MSFQPDPTVPLAEDPATSGLPDPTGPLTASGNLRRRAAVSRLLEVTATASAALAVAIFCIVVYAIASRGLGAISWGFLTSDLNPVNPALGGIAPAIVGTAVMIAIATAIAMPLGVLIAIYLIEFAGRRSGRVIRMALDLTNGLPTVVVAIMVYGLLVVNHGDSAIAASIALAIIMLPLIARSSHQVLLLVPGTLREAADALGVSRWRGVIGVVLPSSLGGIVTATILAAARAAGETVPLLLLTSLVTAQNVQLDPAHALYGMPFVIYQDLESGVPSGITQAWGTAFVLMAFILAANIGSRMFLARNRSRLGL
jgi:phosphate transport system permease protein